MRLPASAFQTIGRHVSLDARHGEELQRALDDLSVTAKQRQLLVRSAIAAANGMQDLMADITANVSRMRVTSQQPQEAAGA
jgi:hypothetical protein